MTAYDAGTWQLFISDGEVSETFHPIGTVRQARVQVERDARAADTLDGNGWQAMHGDGGLRRVTLSADGVCTDAAAEALLRAHAYAGTVGRMRVEFPDGALVTAQFVFTRYEYRVAVDDALGFSLQAVSASAVEYVAG